MKRLLLSLAFLLATIPAQSQQQNFGGGGGTTIVTTNPATCTPPATFFNTSTGQFLICASANTLTVDSTALPSVGAFPSGMMGWYRCLASDTAASLADYSGNGRPATGTVGTAPTILTGIGGCNFTGNGAIILPAALNTALTVVVLTGHQQNGESNGFSAPFMGNGGGTATHGTGLIDCQSTFTSCSPIPGATQSLYWPFAFNSTGFTSNTRSNVNGIHSQGLTMGANDIVYEDGVNINLGTGSSSAGIQTLGSFQIGGAAAGSGAASQTYFTGPIYEVIFFSPVLTQPQMQQVHNLLIQDFVNRGGVANVGTTTTTDQQTCQGDSLTGYGGVSPVTQGYCDLTALSGTWLRANMGITATTMAQAYSLIPLWQEVLFPVFGTPIGRRLIILWDGTNDFVLNGTSAAVTWQNMAAFGIREHGFLGNKILVATTISRQFTNFDSNFKDVLNPLIRQHCLEVADGCIDLGSSIPLGADGASNAQPVYFIENPTGVHPTQNSVYNIIVPIFQHAVNALYGNHDFTTGNTYSSTTPVAVATTNATEATNTMTFTVASGAPPAGSCAIVAGVTPAGYNSPANQCGWYVITSNGTTSFTAYNNTTGLGAQSVAGTVSFPQEVDADNYATLAQNAAGIHVLETCVGRTAAPFNVILRRITSTVAWTITPFVAAETINGAATFTTPVASAGNNPIVRLEAVLTSQAAGGCTWKASLE